MFSTLLTIQMRTGDGTSLLASSQTIQGRRWSQLIPLASNSLNSVVISHLERDKLRAVKSAKAGRYSNLTIRKIPKTVLS